MSMITIGTTYEGKELALIKDSGNQVINWGNNPIKIDKTALAALNMTNVLSIIQGTSKSPSELAGINTQDIVCDAIHVIDNEYRAAIRDYKEALVTAEGNDEEHIKHLKSVYSIYGGGFWHWWYAMRETFGGNYRSESFVAKEGSVHRIKWLTRIDIGEEKRFKAIKEQVKATFDTLTKELKELEAKNQSDENRKKQLAQLILVNNTIFPTEKLAITQ